MDEKGSDTSDSDPSSDSDFSDSDNPEWQELQERTNCLRNLRKKTYETRQRKRQRKVSDNAVLKSSGGKEGKAKTCPVRKRRKMLSNKL